MIPRIRAGLALAAVALCGCSTMQLYTPEDRTQAAEGQYCGTPYAWWKFQSPVITANIAAQPCPQGLCGTLKLAVAGAARVAFVGTAMAVADDTSSGSVPLMDAKGVALQPGAVIPPTKPGGDAPFYQFVGPAPLGAKILLAAPILDVDGRHVSLPAARMVRVERKTSTPCL